VVAVERAFVIADLSGFAATVEAHGDETAADLAQLLVRSAEASLGAGDELVKSMGDAVLVACSEPTAAVRFLRALFARLEAHPEVPLVRAGAHHGSAVRRDGDYFGAALNVAARVADLAAPCEILVTAGVAEAARAEGVGVVALGRFDLRHMTEPLELFELDCGLGGHGHTVDPVCRMRVARDHAVARVRFEGVEYWFCSMDCASRFTSEPRSYVPPA
jgi:adenylate cyclase